MATHCLQWPPSSGKQLFTLLLRPTASSPLLVNLEAHNKEYNSKRLNPEPHHMCPDDGYVAFYASELVSGYLEKSLLGGGAKSSLFAVLLRDHSAEASALTMGRLAKLTSRFLMDYGFSIGIVDVQPTPRLTEEKAKLLARGYLQCKESTPHPPLPSPPFLPPDLPYLGPPRPFLPCLPSPPLLTRHPPPLLDRTRRMPSTRATSPRRPAARWSRLSNRR